MSDLLKITPFIFVARESYYDILTTFHVRFNPKIQLREEIFEFYYHSLWFPGYFGFNWDALYDCLCDFSWMPYNKVAIVHYALPKIERKELKIYLEVLRDASLDWKEGEEHSLDVIFPENFREEIEALLSEIE